MSQGLRDHTSPKPDLYIDLSTTSVVANITCFLIVCI